MKHSSLLVDKVFVGKAFVGRALKHSGFGIDKNACLVSILGKS
jgi:hypothetical protein